MPDDAAVGLTTVAADELEFVNGVAQTEPLPKAQRVRPVHGPDGDVQDVSDDAPLPVAAAGVVAALVDLQTALDSRLDALAGYTDQLEALLTSLGTNTDGIEGLLTTLGGYTDTLEALLAPSTPTNIPGTSGAITGATGVLMGVSARETSGTATAFFRLRAGGATGAVLATVTLAANESIRDWYGPSGIAATGGVYYELVSGAVAGGVQTR